MAKEGADCHPELTQYLRNAKAGLSDPPGRPNKPSKAALPSAAGKPNRPAKRAAKAPTEPAAPEAEEAAGKKASTKRPARRAAKASAEPAAAEDWAMGKPAKKRSPNRPAKAEPAAAEEGAKKIAQRRSPKRQAKATAEPAAAAEEAEPAAAEEAAKGGKAAKKRPPKRQAKATAEPAAAAEEAEPAAAEEAAKGGKAAKKRSPRRQAKATAEPAAAAEEAEPAAAEEAAKGGKAAKKRSPRRQAKATAEPAAAAEEPAAEASASGKRNRQPKRRTAEKPAAEAEPAAGEDWRPPPPRPAVEFRKEIRQRMERRVKMLATASDSEKMVREEMEALQGDLERLEMQPGLEEDDSDEPLDLPVDGSCSSGNGSPQLIAVTIDPLTPDTDPQPAPHAKPPPLSLSAQLEPSDDPLSPEREERNKMREAALERMHQNSSPGLQEEPGSPRASDGSKLSRSERIARRDAELKRLNDQLSEQKQGCL